MEQTQDMEWAMDVLSPASESDVWDRYVATNRLITLANYGASPSIRQMAALFLSNRAGMVS